MASVADSKDVGVGGDGSGDDDVKEPFPLEPLAKSMKAIVFDRFAEESHSFEEEIKSLIQLEHKQPMPSIKPDQVLVKVHAASINPVDWKILKGNLSLVTSAPPIVPGFDVAGTVIRLGSKAKRLKLGDSVYGMTTVSDLGTFAEYVAMPEHVLSLKPAGLTFVEAATVPLAAITSYQGLVRSGKFHAGHKILVLGGSGGTGYFAIQIAKHLGAAEIVTTCSPANNDLLKAAGATRTIDYHSEVWWEELKGQDFDMVYDTVGGLESWEKSPRVLKPKTGRYITICGDSQGKLSIARVMQTAGAIVNRKFWSLFGYNGYDLVMTRTRHEDLTEITKMIDAGSVKPFVEAVYPLEDAHKLYLHSFRGRTRCKIALSVDDKAGEK